MVGGKLTICIIILCFEMGLIFKDWQQSQYMMQLMMLNLVACFACLSGIAFAQFEFIEALSGSVSFPDVAFACIGNLAIFFTCLLRGRLDLENGARDVLATNRGPELVKTNETEYHGWTTCEDNGKGGRKYEDAAVVMLSGNTSSPSVKQFMRYIQHSHGVHSILLKCRFLQLATDDRAEIQCHHECTCFLVWREDRAEIQGRHKCRCVLVWTEEEEIRMMVARRMPGTLKQLSGSVCLLPSEGCLRNGCHGCDQGLLHLKKSAEDSDHQPERRSREEDSNEKSPSAEVEEPRAESQADQRLVDIKEDTVLQQRLTEEGPCCPSSEAESQADQRLVDIKEDTVLQQRLTEGPSAKSVYAVSQMTCWSDSEHEHRCMCIPLREAEKDEWTRLMIRFMRSKDTEVRGVRVLASDAMEKYIDRSGESAAQVTPHKRENTIEENYPRFSLLVQRFIEIIVNVLLTGWLRVDGLSSSLMARRVVRDYLVDSKGTGFAANAFLSFACIKSTQSSFNCIKCNQSTQSSVCQILTFRGNILGVRTLAYVVGCVNLICSIGWVVLIASEASVGKRYAIHSMPPSKYRVIVILVGIGIALLMDSLALFSFYKLSTMSTKKIRDLSELNENQMKKKVRMVCAMMVLEIIYIAAGCVLVVKGLSMQKMSSGKGRWVYSALQILIWLKWGIGSFLLGDRDDRVDYHRLQSMRHRSSFLVDLVFSHGVMVYSSAFMLNAILAGVRGKW